MNDFTLNALESAEGQNTSTAVFTDGAEASVQKTADGTPEIPVTVTFRQEKARTMLDMINAFRTGTSDTTFSPNDPVTRAQTVTFLYRYKDESPVKGKLPFKDVGSKAFYRKAVLWAYQNDVTKGTSDTTFSPGDACNRGQAVTFLYRTVETKE